MQISFAIVPFPPAAQGCRQLRQGLMETRKPEGEGMGGKDDLEKSCRGGFLTAIVPVWRRTAADLLQRKPNVLLSAAIRLQRV
jgi:hypothetical protein